jgi:calcineurin-like phosphoesterase family protein
MSTTFYWSDLHFGQHDVADERGFTSPDLHDDHLIDAWLRTVSDADNIWLLGDLALASPARALEIIRYLPGTKHLILGNHDRAHPMHPDAHRHHARYRDVFASVATMARHDLGGHDVMLSHFPYRDDSRTRDRYRQYRLRNEGRWLIHGHVHDEFAVEDRQINAGVDQWMDGPATAGQLLALISGNTAAPAAA